MAIAFTAVLYTVTFTEAGLPAGTSWTVTFDGVPGTSSGTTIAFHAANGSYAYKIANVSGYSLVPWSGSQLVSGPGAGVTVAFTANSSSSVPGGTDLFWALLAAVIVLAGPRGCARAPRPEKARRCSRRVVPTSGRRGARPISRRDRGRAPTGRDRSPPAEWKES